MVRPKTQAKKINPATQRPTKADLLLIAIVVSVLAVPAGFWSLFDWMWFGNSDAPGDHAQSVRGAVTFFVVLFIFVGVWLLYLTRTNPVKRGSSTVDKSAWWKP